jgi:hypothetical protein
MYNFDPKIYIELNNDLCHMSEEEAKIHYETQAYKENRKYKYENIPDDFEAKIYIELNNDLSHMTEMEAKIHYEIQGYKEDRYYSYKQIDLNYNIYVYCCGKSGSSTLTNTFNKNGYNALHLHSSNYFIVNCAESKLNPNIFNLIENSMKNHETIYIVDSYRNPIERKISSFFQNYKEDNRCIDYITKQLNQSIYAIENYSSIIEVFNYFKIPPFTSFDFEKKYNLVKYKNIVIIKLRFEDINEWGNILSEIMGKTITIYNDNLSDNKNYYNEYKIIKNNYRIPSDLIEIIKNNIEFKIYNSLESQQKYVQYWRNRSIPHIFVYNNIPSDFDPKIYIELNEDLSHMTEEEAKIHYEYTGYKENRAYSK